MGSPNTTNATASTTLFIAKGIDMSKLLDELMEEISPEIPEDAVTVKMLQDKGATRYEAREILREKHENHGWNKVWYKGAYWYWK